MSFLDESDFDSKNRALKTNYDDDDDDLSNQFGNRVNLGTPSGGRARMLAQEREKQLKRRQNAAQSEGMVRSSVSPANSKPAQGQFTPAIRQFSAPKSVMALEDDDEENEELDKLARSKSSQLGRSANSRTTGYDDGEDDLDDNDYRRSKRREDNAKLKIVNKNYEDSDDENTNRKGTSKQDRIAEQLAQHHSKVVKVTEAHKAYNSNNKGSYRDDDEDEDDDENDNRNSYGRPSKNSSVAAPRQSYQRNHYQNDDDDDNDDDNRASKDNWAKPKTKSNRSMGNDRESAASSRSGSRHRRHQDDDDEDDDDDDGDHVVDDDEEDDEDGEGGARTRKQNIPVEPLDLSDMKRFLLSPIPRGCGIVQCYIKRNKVGVNKLFPVYSLYLKEPNRFLMASKKRPNNKTSNYLISMNEADLSRDGANYLGKLRSNFVGTEFQIFDDGVNPNDGEKNHPHHADIRKELGAVIYAANVLGSRGPRKMQVAIPGVDENNEVIPFVPSGRPSAYSPPKRKSSFSLFGGSTTEDTLSNGDDLLARIKDRNFRNLAYFINKPPRWNDQVGAYVLNFNGRVTMASVKNFQLVDPDEINDVNLQFGRVGKDDFTMDLQWPMSPFQAFAITLSSFDSKIACD